MLLPAAAGFPAQPKCAGGWKGDAQDLAKDGKVFVPADPWARSVFSDEDLLEVSGSDAREGFGPCTDEDKKFRHVFGLRKAASIEIIAPAERNRPALADESLKLELPERKALDLTQ